MSTQDFFQFCKDSFSDPNKSVLSKVSLAVGVVTGACMLLFVACMVVMLFVAFPTSLLIVAGLLSGVLAFKTLLDYDTWKIVNNRPRKTTNHP